MQSSYVNMTSTTGAAQPVYRPTLSEHDLQYMAATLLTWPYNVLTMIQGLHLHFTEFHHIINR